MRSSLSRTADEGRLLQEPGARPRRSCNKTDRYDSEDPVDLRIAVGCVGCDLPLFTTRVGGLRGKLQLLVCLGQELPSLFRVSVHIVSVVVLRG